MENRESVTQRRNSAGSPPSAVASLKRLVAQADGSGIDTSEGNLFNHTVWGRDRAITALDVIDWQPDLARQSILALARLQGTSICLRSEEQPGRIHNEYRDLEKWQAPWWLKLVFRYLLAPTWGGTRRGYIEFFAADATPLYMILVSRYALIDPGILDARVRHHNGSHVTIRQSVLAAALWLVEQMGDDGLIEISKSNPISLPSPTWKDSPTSNLDEWGHVLNVLSPVSWLLVQGLAVDGLRELADALRETDDDAAGDGLSDLLRDLADAARDALLRHFWNENMQYFGFAVDRDTNCCRRLVTAVQSDAGWLLDSCVFDDLSESDRRRYVGGIVQRLFRPDMITAAGVRGRSLTFDDAGLLNYHETVWPMDTLKIARGLRRQGFDELAALLEDRLLNAINALGSHYEFIPVDALGRVIDPRHTPESQNGVPRRPLSAEMVPDENLAWSVTGVLRVKRERGCRQSVAPIRREAWVEELTAQVLEDVRAQPLRTSSQDIGGLRQEFAPLYLSHWRGLMRSASKIVVGGFGRALPAGYLCQIRGRRQGVWR